MSQSYRGPLLGKCDSISSLCLEGKKEGRKEGRKGRKEESRKFNLFPRKA
jgi:hypothetical protein